MAKTSSFKKRMIEAIASGDLKAIRDLNDERAGKLVVLSSFLDALMFTSWLEEDQDLVRVEVCGDLKHLLEEITNKPTCEATEPYEELLND